MRKGVWWERQKQETAKRKQIKWENDIKMHIRETGWVAMDSIHLAQDKDIGGSCEHGNELFGSIKCWNILVKLRDWQLLKKSSAP
jgi:hypothetical protein